MAKVVAKSQKLGFLIIICLAIVLWLTLTGCKAGTCFDSDNQPSLSGAEVSDQEVFNKHFSGIGLKRIDNIFTGSSTREAGTFLPHQEGHLYLGFKTK